ncbi:DNA-binding protein SMUBP-2 [Copidosoma floridanum]|uniref:DNA-binding protein SMUBP-2 n=1 Tax=Copidosoma floridanum TaxID=29053 RepID=UPI000C6F88B0|nr:DNA-binding protein SMUBP-2 [Copidosoma floridanum]
MDDTITKFVRKHLQLLLLEREEDLQKFFNDFSPVNLHYLEKSGLALTKLNINNSVCNGPERYQIDFEKADGLPLEHGLSRGDLVICIRSKEKGQMIKAIVMDISESTLSISSNGQYEDVQDDEQFTVVKSDSDYTYRSQTRALNALEKKEIYSSQCLEIIKILFHKDEDVIHQLLVAEDPILKTILDDDDNIKFHNRSLAKDQKLAVEFSLKRRHFAIVQGPPGTGKTTTLIEAVVQLHRLGKKILICAPTNVAVDNLVIRLGGTEAKPLRLGHPTRIAKSALKYSLDSYLERDDSFKDLKDIKKSIKNLETNVESSGRKYIYKEIRDLKKEYRKRLSRLTCDILRRSTVILCTLNSASATNGQIQSLPKDHFDVLIVDEASQAMEASMWIAIPNAPKLILAGDINQLPPVVLCQKAVDGGLNISLMERAIKKLKDNCFVRLTRQYRMNEKIMSWASAKFYDNTLEADDSVKNHLLKDLPLSDKHDDTLTSEAIVFIDTCGCDCEEFRSGVDSASKGNVREVIVVHKVVTALIKTGLRHRDIGVITPYALQVDFIKRNFASDSYNVEVSTVDGFQGREKEAIIISLVRSNQEKELGFVTDFRRLNVAVTRARRSLIVIGDSETMESDDVIKSLLNHIEENGLLQSAEEYLSETVDKEREIEKPLQKNLKSKSKLKTKNKSVKKQKNSKSKNDMPKAQKQVNPQPSEALKKPLDRTSEKKTDPNICMNRKMYNIYETISTVHSDQENDEPDEEESSLLEISEKRPNKEQSKKEQTMEKFEIKGTKERVYKKIEVTEKNSENEVLQDKSEVKKEDNFDKIVQEFAKSNSTCSYQGCKKSTKLIQLICQFCKKWYCLEHGLQEIHGCGNAIRQKARKDFRQKQKKIETCTKKEKDKFTKKLKELEELRKPKKKATK